MIVNLRYPSDFRIYYTTTSTIADPRVRKWIEYRDIFYNLQAVC